MKYRNFIYAFLICSNLLANAPLDWADEFTDYKLSTKRYNYEAVSAISLNSDENFFLIIDNMIRYSRNNSSIEQIKVGLYHLKFSSSLVEAEVKLSEIDQISHIIDVSLVLSSKAYDSIFITPLSEILKLNKVAELVDYFSLNFVTPILNSVSKKFTTVVENDKQVIKNAYFKDAKGNARKMFVLTQKASKVADLKKGVNSKERNYIITSLSHSEFVGKKYLYRSNMHSEIMKQYFVFNSSLALEERAGVFFNLVEVDAVSKLKVLIYSGKERFFIGEKITIFLNNFAKNLFESSNFECCDVFIPFSDSQAIEKFFENVIVGLDLTNVFDNGNIFEKFLYLFLQYQKAAKDDAAQMQDQAKQAQELAQSLIEEEDAKKRKKISKPSAKQVSKSVVQPAKKIAQKPVAKVSHVDVQVFAEEAVTKTEFAQEVKLELLQLDQAKEVEEKIEIPVAIIEEELDKEEEQEWVQFEKKKADAKALNVPQTCNSHEKDAQKEVEKLKQELYEIIPKQGVDNFSQFRKIFKQITDLIGFEEGVNVIVKGSHMNLHTQRGVVVIPTVHKNQKLHQKQLVNKALQMKAIL